MAAQAKTKRLIVVLATVLLLLLLVVCGVFAFILATTEQPPIEADEPVASLAADHVVGSELKQPPLELSQQFEHQRYEGGANTNTWRASTQQDCEQAATSILSTLQTEKWHLKESGYLDLNGNAWGCIAIKGTAPNQRVLTISLLPQSATLQLNIVEILAP
jgi:hypothetical protein